MSNKIYPYNFDNQFERFIGQFARVFSGFQVKSGKKDVDGNTILERVPVAIGSMDRVVASIISERDEFVNFRLPMISINMTAVDLDSANRRTKKEVVIDSTPFPTTKVNQRRLAGPPIRLTFEVAVMASSVTQLLELVEQILLIFNPRVTVNFKSNIYDESTRSEITMTSVSPQTTVPLGSTSQTPVIEFGFDMGARLRFPRLGNDNFIEQIITKTFTVDEDEDDQQIMEATIDESDL